MNLWALTMMYGTNSSLLKLRKQLALAVSGVISLTQKCRYTAVRAAALRPWRAEQQQLLLRD